MAEFIDWFVLLTYYFFLSPFPSFSCEKNDFDAKTGYLGLNIEIPISEAEDIQNETYNWQDTDSYFTGYVLQAPSSGHIGYLADGLPLGLVYSIRFIVWYVL